jgi:hypothetical protein
MTPDGNKGSIIIANNALAIFSVLKIPTNSGRGMFINYEGKNASQVNWIQFFTLTAIVSLNNGNKVVKDSQMTVPVPLFGDVTNSPFADIPVLLGANPTVGQRVPPKWFIDTVAPKNNEAAPFPVSTTTTPFAIDSGSIGNRILNRVWFLDAPTLPTGFAWQFAQDYKPPQGDTFTSVTVTAVFVAVAVFNGKPFAVIPWVCTATATKNDVVSTPPVLVAGVYLPNDPRVAVLLPELKATLGGQLRNYNQGLQQLLQAF